MLSLLKERRGQALVEFSLVLPILLLLLFGMLQFGLVLQSYLAVNMAAREGARTAAIGGSNSQVKHRVLHTAPTLSSDKLIIKIDRFAKTVTVTVATPTRVFLPFVSSFVPSHVAGRVSMMIEKSSP